MNVRLLRKIAKVIQEKPRQFNMTYWHRNENVAMERIRAWDFKSFESLCDIPADKQISCDTTHCIAGWAQVLAPNRKCSIPASEDAQRLLGLTEQQASRLFFADCWPKEFLGTKHIWRMSPAKAAARIEHFIKTKGRE